MGVSINGIAVPNGVVVTRTTRDRIADVATICAAILLCLYAFGIVKP